MRILLAACAFQPSVANQAKEDQSLPLAIAASTLVCEHFIDSDAEVAGQFPDRLPAYSSC